VGKIGLKTHSHQFESEQSEAVVNPAFKADIHQRDEEEEVGGNVLELIKQPSSKIVKRK
jgi:hypothetical protein